MLYIVHSQRLDAPLSAPDPAYRALKPGPFEPKPTSEASPDTGAATKERPEHAILCGSCRHAVTRERLRIQVDGRHQHRFMNPHGFLFDIGCFHDAPGCLAMGEPTTEFTWFPGFAWRFAVCAACQEHLGWAFEGTGGARFFGLVLNRLIAPDGEPDTEGE